MSESIISSDYCSKLKYIPQFSGTCWFNSILNVMLYSTGMRRVLQNGFNNNLKVIERDNSDKLLTFLLFMLQNYNNIYELEKIYKSFKDFTLKPEYLLMSYLNKYDLNTKQYIINKTRKNYKSFGYNTIYITHILKTYNIPYINIIKSETGNFYLNLKIHPRLKDNYIYINNLIEENLNDRYLDNKLKKSDILFISTGTGNFYDFHDINKFNKLETYFTTSNENLKEFKQNIHELNETINIKGYIYKLDSCIISSTNDAINTYSKIIYHAISGITCNNNKYAIDSRSKIILSETSKDIKLKYDIVDSTLKFNKVDWYTTLKEDNDIYSDTRTNTISVKNKTRSLMDDVSMKERVYNKKDSIIYIYIKVNDLLKSTDIKIPVSNSKNAKLKINTKSLIFEKELLSKYNKDIYNLEKLSINELANIIKNITNAKEVYEDISYYRYIYNYYNKDNKILKVNIDEYNKEDMLKKLFIRLINNFFYYGIIIKLDRYTDYKLFPPLIKHYYSIISNIENLNKILRAYKVPIAYEYIIDNIETIKDLLFKTKYNFYYDKYIEEFVSEEEMIKRIIIKLIFHSEYYSEILKI